jgi:probable phosphoglycerate mutase
MADEIWLIRHGETAWTLSGQHTGRTDVPLTPRGEEEARAVGARLQGQSFSLVLCSPLQRARRTCEIAGFLPQAILDPECMEWDYGDLNGRTREELRAEQPGWNIWNYPAPHGESLEDVAARAAIFAHGHFLRILTATYLELPPAAARHFALATGRLSVLGVDNGYAAILGWNT